MNGDLETVVATLGKRTLEWLCCHIRDATKRRFTNMRENSSRGTYCYCLRSLKVKVLEKYSKAPRPWFPANEGISEL